MQILCNKLLHFNNCWLFLHFLFIKCFHEPTVKRWFFLLKRIFRQLHDVSAETFRFFTWLSLVKAVWLRLLDLKGWQVSEIIEYWCLLSSFIDLVQLFSCSDFLVKLHDGLTILFVLRGVMLSHDIFLDIFVVDALLEERNVLSNVNLDGSPLFLLALPSISRNARRVFRCYLAHAVRWHHLDILTFDYFLQISYWKSSLFVKSFWNGVENEIVEFDVSQLAFISQFHLELELPEDLH